MWDSGTWDSGTWDSGTWDSGTWDAGTQGHAGTRERDKQTTPGICAEFAKLFNENKYPDHAFLKKQPTMMTSSDEALSDLLQVTKQMTLQPV